MQRLLVPSRKMPRGSNPDPRRAATALSVRIAARTSARDDAAVRPVTGRSGEAAVQTGSPAVSIDRGLEATEEFCEVARHLTRPAGLDSRVDFELDDALAMPFAEAAFDGAYSMYLSMNIAEKAASASCALCPSRTSYHQP
jgi:hypothetical protein